MSEPMDFQLRLSATEGYWSNMGLLGAGRALDAMIGSVNGSEIKGSKNVIVRGPGYLESWNGLQSTSATGNMTMMLVGDKIGSLVSGTVLLFTGNSIWYIGSGVVTVDGVSKGLATPRLQLVLAGQNLPFLAGLHPPVQAPTVQPVGAGKNKGSFSVKVTKIRSQTGAESAASPASNVAIANNQKIEVTFPSTIGDIDVVGTSGFDKWGVYVSKAGFGNSGPWFRLLPDAAVSSQKAIYEWFNGDLTDILAPLDYDPPLDATHVFALGNVMCLAGVLGGIGLSPSIPGKPEAFPPDLITFLNPAEPILGIKGRPSDGWQYILCRNSLQAAILTGSSVTPILPRAIWPEIGVASQQGAAFVGNELFGFSGQRAAFKTQGQSTEPDTSFATAVEDIMADWQPENVVVAWSPNENLVLFAHDTVGLAYMRNSGKWSAPLDLSNPSGTVKSAITVAGQLKLVCGNTLYDFGKGTQDSDWVLQYAWQDKAAPAYYSTVTGWRTALTATRQVTTELLTNLNDSLVKDNQVIEPSQEQHVKWKKTNIKNVLSFTLRHKGRGARERIHESVVIGEIDPGRY